MSRAFAATFVFHGCKSFLLTSARARSPMSARCSTRKFITMNLAGGALNPLSKPELTGNEDAEEFASAKKHEADALFDELDIAGRGELPYADLEKVLRLEGQSDK